ncbi:MAG: phosphotransferase, partial [Rhodospirillaceae bacterium]|nr:phosphotransferase [Rhodospirillaceae bacterium]
EECLEMALEAVLRIQSVASDVVPPYEVSRFRDELGIFTEWLVHRFLGLETPSFIANTWEILIAATQAQPMVTVHRDYHSRNLLLRDDGSLGIVDFQDALVGPVTYDLVSLLRDCYHVFPEATVAQWLARYLQRANCGMIAPEFRRAFDLTGVQRHLKAAGIFARLKLRDGRVSHLRDIAPTLERVADVAGGYPELMDLGRWVGNVVLPAAIRAVARP